MCDGCAARPKGKDEDYCPDHRERAGLGRASLDTTGSRWIDARFPGRCKEPKCGAAISQGDRVLYLPAEKGVLCEECGENI